jgi:predicted lipoprotein with Yx(FWY)xxD motif
MLQRPCPIPAQHNHNKRNFCWKGLFLMLSPPRLIDRWDTGERNHVSELQTNVRKVAVGLAAVLGLGAVTASSAGAATSGKVWSFRSAPNLQPMRVTVDVSRPGRAPGLIFIDPFSSGAGTFYGQPGALILDQKGNPIYFHPAPSGQQDVDTRVQTLHGKPVLTFWQGTIAIPPKLTNLPPGSPEPGAKFLILDNRYRQIATVSAQDGWTADLHEMLITPQGDAMIAVAKEMPYDLRPYGGPQNGSLEDSGIQVISLKTGKLLWQWDMLQHVALSEAQVKVPAKGVWDPYHLNSIDEDTHGHLLISARDTWGIYELSRASGKVLFQVGGKGATINTSRAATFAWQHDARFQPHGQISLFDDACCNLPVGKPLHYARGLVLKVSQAKHTATVARQYVRNQPLYVPSQGDAQLLPGGGAMVGWGQEPYLTEFNGAGREILDMQMPQGDNSYRALLSPWSAAPYYAPRLSVSPGKGARKTIYASWNGATGVAGWEVLGGNSAKQLKVLVKHAASRGFETAVTVSSKAKVFAVVALAADGKALRRSPALSIKSSSAPTTLSPTYGARQAAVTEITTHKTNAGTVVAAANGHSLYMFSGRSCTARCARTWRPLMAVGRLEVARGSGLNPKKLGRVKYGRAYQLTYNRHALFLYAGDRKPGEDKGEGQNQFGGYWYLLYSNGNEDFVLSPTY